ncbi:VOC family protein [Nocardiopsis coralliicola]
MPPFISIALPVADRAATLRFYREAFGWDPLGEPSEDGIPEPLEFALDARARLTFIPTGGFEWVIGDRAVAAPGTSECLLTMPLDGEAAVDGLTERIRRAGGTVIAGPERQPWGYTAACADPDGHLWQITTEADAGA